MDIWRGGAPRATVGASRLWSTCHSTSSESASLACLHIRHFIMCSRTGRTTIHILTGIVLWSHPQVYLPTLCCDSAAESRPAL